MDVILDANIILGNPRFNSPTMLELLAYVRRTRSRLVVPCVVIDEVLERYREQLTAKLDKARGHWTELQKMSLSRPDGLPSVNIDRSVDLLRDRLHRPANGVESLVHSETSNIDVRDVARRGIKRKRPANKNGEQLRDVIVWLTVLQHCREAAREVAFISGDEDFRLSKESDQLHPDLESEIRQEKLPIRFYREPAGFVRDHSLANHALAREWGSKLLAMREFHEEMKRELLELPVTDGTLIEADIASTEFVEGIEYTVSEESTYVEAKYSGEAMLTLREDKPWTHITMPVYSGQVATGWSNANNVILAQTMFPPAGLISGTTVLNAAGAVQYPKVLNNVVSGQFQPTFVDYRIRCEFALEVSVRTEKGEFAEWQIDELHSTSSSPVSP